MWFSLNNIEITIKRTISSNCLHIFISEHFEIYENNRKYSRLQVLLHYGPQLRNMGMCSFGRPRKRETDGDGIHSNSIPSIYYNTQVIVVVIV